MATIKLDSTAFISAAADPALAGTELSFVDCGSAEAGSCSGLMISEYIEMYNRIANLTLEYAGLLRSDCIDMMHTAQSIEAADNAAAGGWK